MKVTASFKQRLLQCVHRLDKPRATKVTNMMQLKKGMMVLRQVEQTADQQWGKTAQQRVVLSTRVNQEQETRDRRFQKGMMVGSAAKSRD
jgi:hypothetical protein